ncbi:hypothetical protein DFS33DRAFT_1362701 [Desarmillaria ectypa]|nr:hypothetical protein DFS33DRAFT_1362701 [Desarmillaria ectypa]
MYSRGTICSSTICLSSCKDSQSTWETDNGWSMTNALIELCKREAHPTLKDLMLHITRETKKAISKIHRQNQSYAIEALAWYRKCVTEEKRVPVSEVEKIRDYLRRNFRQDPQLSSDPSPMDMPNVRWNP